MKPSALSLAIAQLLGTVAAGAAEIVVDSSGNSVSSNGNCTLPEAILAANTDAPQDGCASGSGEDEITFNIPTPATISVGNTLNLQPGITIAGPGRNRLLIEATGQGAFRIESTAGAEVVLRDLTIRGTRGPAISNAGTAVLRNVTISGGVSAGRGGALENTGTMTLEGAVLADNSASAGGGAIYNRGDLTLHETEVAYNEASYGGGIFSRSGVVRVEDSTIIGNSVSLDGGGILGLGEVELIRSRVTGNVAGTGGGWWQSSPEAFLNRSTVDHNSAAGNGGGIYIRDTDLAADRSTITSNQAARGGGVYSASSSLALLSSTIYQNQASSGAALQTRSSNSSIRRSVVAGNSGTACNARASDVADSFVDDPRCGGSKVGKKGGAPVLTGLMARGGAPAHVPTPSSPLLDALDDAGCDQADQSGRPRPVDADGSGGQRNCDIGAAERQAAEFGVRPGVSGLWFNARRAGEGFLIDHLGSGRANVFFFTYDASGRPMWLIGDARVEHNRLRIAEMLIAEGAMFGPAFDPDAVQLEVWGSMTFEFLDCNRGQVVYSSGEFGSGRLSLERLSSIAGVSCEPVFDQASLRKEIVNGNSGAFFDPARAGEGIQIQMVAGAQGLVPVVYWFTYDSAGNQLWILGVGRVEGDSIVIDDAQHFSGPTFGPAFSSADVVATAFGTLRLDFQGCDSVTLTYASPAAEFGDGELTLIRLYQTAGTHCP